jgi:protein-disulfide isomerase
MRSCQEEAVIRTWCKLTALALVAALVVPSLVGQAKLTPAELTLKKSLGSSTAPIKLEIFSDYQCPACREMHLNTTRQVIDNYVSTGKVYLVHRDFPLTMHPYSRVAARWLNAAAAVGSFQAAETALYSKQDQWGTTGNVEQALASSLPAAQMNKVRAMEIAQRAQLDAAVQSDVNTGTSRNVNGTPSVFVIHRGQTIPLPSGPVPYALLKQYLDSLLAQR